MKRFATFLPVVMVTAVLFAVVAEPAYAQNLDALRINFFSGNFGSVFRRILNFFLLIAGITAFFYILYGGFTYLTAGGEPAKATKGQQYIANAIIGVVIVAAAYALSNYVINFTQTDSDTIF